MSKSVLFWFVLVVFPLGTNFLLAWEFDKGQIDEVPMVVCDEDNSATSRMIIQEFQNNEMFHITERVDNEEDIEPLIRDSRVRLGMVIPNNFNEDMKALESPSILMIYDGSHMPITAAVKARASEILLSIKAGVSMQLMAAKLDIPDEEQTQDIALPLGFTTRTLYNPAKNYQSFMNIGLVLALVQSATALLAAAAVRKEEIPHTVRKKVGYFIGKTVFYSIVSSAALILNVCILKNIVGIPFRGEFFHAVVLSLCMGTAIATISCTFSALIPVPTLSMLVNAMLFVPNTVMIGYTWPVFAMPRLYQTLAPFYPLYHYADNMRGLFIKGRTGIDLYDDYRWYGAFIIIVLFIGCAGIAIRKSVQLKEEKTNSVRMGKEGTNIVS